jgi:C4-dicarboxylate transporter, DctQ subunit
LILNENLSFAKGSKDSIFLHAESRLSSASRCLHNDIPSDMKNFLHPLFNCFERISRLGAVLAEICLVLLLILVFNEVIARYLLNKPTLYSVELSEYLLLFVAFMAAGWVMQNDRHVKMHSVVNLMPEKVRHVLDISTSAIVLVFCLILVWEGAKSSLMAFAGGYHSSSLLNVPLWIPYAIIPIGSLILTLQVLVRIVRLIWPPISSDNP